jgi:glutamyl-tRNA synthetase
VLPEHLQELLAQAEQQRGRAKRGRYAPSPTGRLHLGNLRTALLSWLITRLQGGEWLLRVDDLDTPRNRPGAEEAIVADLEWLGLRWDGPVLRQSQRRGIYATVLSSLRRRGLLYPCRCSRRLLADISAPHGRSPVYPGYCLSQPVQWGVQQGRLPSWRLRLQPGELHWSEALGSPGCLEASTQVGDVVLRRSDGLFAYHLATAVDEALLGIRDVVRGLDLWHTTAPQIALIQILGAGLPDYWHVPLWIDGAGERLSKRDGGLGLPLLREQGHDAASVVGLLAASVGLVEPGARLSAEELLRASELEALRGHLASKA